MEPSYLSPIDGFYRRIIRIAVGGITPFLRKSENPIMGIDDPRIPAAARKMIESKG